MIFLADTSAPLKQVEVEIGREVGQLMTPRSRRKDAGVKFGIDNGAFAGFEEIAFVNLLERHKAAKERCLFVAAPDVVASARRTLEAFDFWFPKLSGWPIALVAQDGQETLEIPWNNITAIFIGGSTEWKLSPEAAQIVKCAKLLGKWVHIGRINSGLRLDYFTALHADSFDGTGLSRYSHMRHAIGNNQYLYDDAIKATMTVEGMTCSNMHQNGMCAAYFEKK
jgi:hypothetical protein